jgi:CBS domain-containing protein
MSRAAWVRTFQDCLSDPDESDLVRAQVAFDFRLAAGGLALTAELSARVRAAREHGQFMTLIARSAANSQVALGFRSQLSTDDDGRLDLKAGAIIPLVNIVRYHALANGITISPTLDRIEAAAASGGLRRDDADALAEAFDVICRVRFEHHARLIADGVPADNLVAPDTLAPIARSDLREALQAVRKAQKRLPV